jgi:hypothetical protein
MSNLLLPRRHSSLPPRLPVSLSQFQLLPFRYSPLFAVYMAMPFMVLVPGFQMSSTVVIAPMPAPASPADTKVKKDADPPAAAHTPPGVGLPAPLVALLRGEDGPFLANEVFSIAPSQPLAAVPEDTPAPKWYAITRGRFVGVVDQ